MDEIRESHFWPKIMTKNGVCYFYPSAKNRRKLKIKTSGVIFQGAVAHYVQKAIAPPKQAVCLISLFAGMDMISPFSENWSANFNVFIVFKGTNTLPGHFRKITTGTPKYTASWYIHVCFLYFCLGNLSTTLKTVRNDDLQANFQKMEKPYVCPRGFLQR